MPDADTLLGDKHIVLYQGRVYGVGGIYDYNFNIEEVKKAIRIHLLDGETPFEGDSVDREMVRDIVLDEIRGC